MSLPAQPQYAEPGFRSFCVPYSRPVQGRGHMARRLAQGPGKGGARRAPGDAEEARMDEEMSDLLGFLGGSGAT